MALTDKEKAFPVTAKCVRVFNRRGRLLLYSEVKSVGHWGVIRDWDIRLKGGGEICIDPEIIKMIIKHEIKENPDILKDI